MARPSAVPLAMDASTLEDIEKQPYLPIPGSWESSSSWITVRNVGLQVSAVLGNACCRPEDACSFVAGRLGTK